MTFNSPTTPSVPVFGTGAHWGEPNSGGKAAIRSFGGPLASERFSTVSHNPHPASQPKMGFAPKPMPTAAVAPISVTLLRNDVLSRTFIDVFGFLPPTVGLARNFYEGVEKLVDDSIWLGATAVAPVVVDQALSKVASNQLRQRYPQFLKATGPIFNHLGENASSLARVAHWFEKLGQDSVLRVPWGWLSGEGLPHAPLPGVKQAGLNSQLATVAREVGFHSNDALKAFLKNPAARNSVLAAKLGILTADLAVMGLANMAGAWGKNWLTKVMSGKSGFSGEFGVATDAYRSAQAQDYEDNKAKRIRWSWLATLGTTAALPAMVLAGVKSSGKTVAGNALKGMNKLLDYHNGIYASKWLIMWGGLVNALALYAFASRDKHEFREEMTRWGVLMLTYVVGDDILEGLGAKWLQGTPRVQKSGLALAEKGVFGMPKAIPIWETLAKVGNDVTHPVYKLAKTNAWVGLLGATALTGAAIPLVNNAITHQKATDEQKSLLGQYLDLFTYPLSAWHWMTRKTAAESQQPTEAPQAEARGDRFDASFGQTSPLNNLQKATLRFYGTYV